MKAKFQLAGEHTALRIATGGGRELALDGSGHYATDDPDEIATLDAHPATTRVKATRAAKKPKPKAKAPAAVVEPADDAEASA